jgi:hypothetical protein
MHQLVLVHHHLHSSRQPLLPVGRQVLQAGKQWRWSGSVVKFVGQLQTRVLYVHSQLSSGRV